MHVYICIYLCACVFLLCRTCVYIPIFLVFIEKNGMYKYKYVHVYSLFDAQIFLEAILGNEIAYLNVHKQVNVYVGVGMLRQTRH